MLVETGSKESWMQSGDPRGVLCLAAKGEAAVWCRGTSLALGHCKTSDEVGIHIQVISYHWKGLTENMQVRIVVPNSQQLSLKLIVS